jgi:ATP-binding cassette, subfamily B, bacterial
MNSDNPADLKSNTRGARFILGELRRALISIPRAFGLVWNAGPLLTFALMIITLLQSFLPITLLWITKLAIDRIVSLATHQGGPAAAELRSLWLLLGLMGGAWLMESIFDALNGILSNLLQFQVEQHTQALVFEKCSELDIAFFENPKNLDILENASRGAMMSSWSLLWTLFSLLRTFIALCSFLFVLARLHWLALLVAALTTTPQLGVASYFARRRWKIMLDRAEDSRLRYYLSWLMTQRAPSKEIRTFDLAGAFIERFKFFSRKFFGQELILQRRRQFSNLATWIFGYLGAIGIWAYVALRAIARTITIGDVYLYTQALGNSQSYLVSIFSESSQFYEQVLYLGNLFALLDLKPQEVEGALRGPEGVKERWGNRPAPERIRQGIEFRRVSFRYPGCENWILREVSFFLAPDESVAIVGPNGAGKTTLIKLLVRLYDPSEGDIFLDGHNLREYDLPGLRRLFAIIFQDYTRFYLTLRENIGYGDVTQAGNLDKVDVAAKKAGLQNIVERLPQHYETYLARQFIGLGEDLSDGEWQKVALARAYMRDCPVIVLDEPTASLDAFAEHEVYETFQKMAGKRMVIFISHRFSTVRMADHILVLENHSLVEEGTHEALLSREGLYASMFETQAGRYR